MRYSGMHLCVKGSDSGNLAVNNAILGIAMNGYPQYARVRSRLHSGSMMELHYQLKSYGIPVDTCPVDKDGNIRTDILNKWFYEHKALGGLQRDDFLSSLLNSNNDDLLNPIILSDDEEELDSLFEEYNDEIVPFELASSNQNAHFIPLDADHELAAPLRDQLAQLIPEERQEVIVQPSRNDVLLGRGRDIQNHEGNVRFRKFLEPYGDEYDHAPRSKRRKIAREMNELLSSKGIRFLKQSGLHEWVESDAESAERKIAQL